MLVCPKFRLEIGPHSPLASGLRRLQSGTKFPLRGSPTGKKLSFQTRLTWFTDAFTGLASEAIPVVRDSTYRPTLAFTAVLPFPNKSHAAPNRGSRSVQQ